MSKKDCIFQYSTDYGIIKDTLLITREEGDSLWEEHVNRFIEDFEGGCGPEMVLWIDMRTPTNFRTYANYRHHDDILLVNGVLYKKVEM